MEAIAQTLAKLTSGVLRITTTKPLSMNQRVLDELRNAHVDEAVEHLREYARFLASEDPWKPHPYPDRMDIHMCPICFQYHRNDYVHDWQANG